MNKKRILVVDPFNPRGKYSHHESLHYFLKCFDENIEFLILEPNFERKKRKIEIFGKIETFFWLVSYCITLCSTYRSRFNRETILFPNADYVSSTFFLLARKFRVVNVNYIFRNIGIMDTSSLSRVGRFFAKRIVRFCLREIGRAHV